MSRLMLLLGVTAVLGAGCFRVGLSPLDDEPVDGGDDRASPDGDAADGAGDSSEPDGDAADADAPWVDGALPDAGTDADVESPDARPDVDIPGGDGCLLGRFGAPTNVTDINLPSTNSEDPSLTDDMLEIVFSSTRSAGAGVDLWTATRARVTDGWGAATSIAVVNTDSDETTPEISGDGLVLIFASNRPESGGAYDLYQSTRSSRGAAWTAPTRIVELASPANEFAGSLSPDRRTIVFSSSRDGDADLYVAVRASAMSGWDPPTAIEELSSVDDDSAPWLSADLRTIVFSSTRAGGEGDQDLWCASRPTASSTWGPAIALEELNDGGYDSDPWLSPDLRTIVYTRLESSFRNVFAASR